MITNDIEFKTLFNTTNDIDGLWALHDMCGRDIFKELVLNKIEQLEVDQKWDLLCNHIEDGNGVTMIRK